MWFDDVFVQSLFVRAKDGAVNLTAKQTGVCKRYMQAVERVLTGYYGGSYSRPYYRYTWGERELTLETFPNGCGCLIFGASPAERAEAEARHMAEAEERRKRRAMRLQREGKARENHLRRIAQYERELEADRRWMAEHADEVTDDDLEDIALTEKIIADLYREMEV